jgi:capsular exopolysaccharide synthesis family protein
MLIVESKKKSIVSEAYRILRTNIQYSSIDKKLKSIVITSAEEEEGKSTVAGNLALSFAESNNSVILIDCDLRKPSIHKKFKLTNMAGLSDVLIGKELLDECIVKYNSKLHILPSGTLPPNPSEMINSNLMNTLLEFLKTRYDLIILDTTPIIAVADAQILSAKADGTIVVVRAMRTKCESIIETKNILNKVGANIIGTILNGVDNSSRKYSKYYEEGK